MRTHGTKILTLIFIIGALCACSKRNDQDPEAVLKHYINYRFEKDQSRERIADYLLGTMKDDVIAMNEKDFAEYINVDGLRKKRVNFLIKKCTEEVCYLTYTLSYEKFNKDTKEFSVEVRKIAEMRKEDNKWKIVDISNIKSFFDMKADISP